MRKTTTNDTTADGGLELTLGGEVVKILVLKGVAKCDKPCTRGNRPIRFRATECFVCQAAKVDGTIAPSGTPVSEMAHCGMPV